MKKLHLVLLSTLFLSACGGTSTIGFHVTFDKSVESARKTELARSVGKVIQNRVDAMGGTLADVKNTESDTGTDISFTISPASLVDPLTEQLTSPFSFRLMRPVKAGETADLTLQDVGGFKDLGATEHDVLWLLAAPDTDTTKGVVEIIFTEEGRTKVRNIMLKNPGQIALVIRNQLVSTFQNPGKATDDIIIQGIPTIELAMVFADDVNVGVHATFTTAK